MMIDSVRSRWALRLLLGAGLLACIPGKDGADGDDEEDDPYDVDSDRDGLSDGEEEDLGLDPDAADSDDDGWDDSVEVDANTDATDPRDHPYTGGWPIGACRDDLTGEGYRDGDVVENFAMLDQHGDRVSIHDFCDRTIYLVFAAFW